MDEIRYCAVRLTEGKEWISTREVAPLREMVDQLVLDTNRACGKEWADVNPVVRIAKFRLVEEQEKEKDDDYPRT